MMDGLFDGSWKIDGNTLCVDYHSIASDWCGQFAEGADGSIDYYRDGQIREDLFHARCCKRAIHRTC